MIEQEAADARLAPDVRAWLRGRYDELREVRRLAVRAREIMASPDLPGQLVELLEVASAWHDGDSGERAIALIAQAARLARALKAPRDIVDQAGEAESDLLEQCAAYNIGSLAELEALL